MDRKITAEGRVRGLPGPNPAGGKVRATPGAAPKAACKPCKCCAGGASGKNGSSAKLNAARPALAAARRAYDERKLTQMAFVERLEEMEGRGAFPSDWLYSSGIDDLAFSD